MQRLAPLFADLGTVRHREREPYGYGLELGFAGGQLVVLGHNGPVPVPGGGDRGGGPLVPALGLSYRDVEELLAERGIDVDHVTVYRWVQPVSIEASRFVGRWGRVAVQPGSDDNDGTVALGRSTTAGWVMR